MHPRGLTCDFFVSELVLELVGIQVKFTDHIVNVFNVVFQIVFRVLDSLVPQHCEEPFNVLLTSRNVTPHLLISSFVLPSKNVGLALHQSVLLL